MKKAILLLFLISSFYSFNIPNDKIDNLNVLGKWHYTANGVYSNKALRGDISRWVHFKPGQKVEFSSCTDMCGCLRKTDYGKFSWDNDSIISVKISKFSKYSSFKQKLATPINRRYKIKKIDKNQMKIHQIE